MPAFLNYQFRHLIQAANDVYQKSLEPPEDSSIIETAIHTGKQVAKSAGNLLGYKDTSSSKIKDLTSVAELKHEGDLASENLALFEALKEIKHEDGVNFKNLYAILTLCGELVTSPFNGGYYRKVRQLQPLQDKLITLLANIHKPGHPILTELEQLFEAIECYNNETRAEADAARTKLAEWKESEERQIKEKQQRLDTQTKGWDADLTKATKAYHDLHEFYNASILAAKKQHTELTEKHQRERLEEKTTLETTILTLKKQAEDESIEAILLRNKLAKSTLELAEAKKTIEELTKKITHLETTWQETLDSHLSPLLNELRAREKAGWVKADLSGKAETTSNEAKSKNKSQNSGFGSASFGFSNSSKSTAKRPAVENKGSHAAIARQK